MFKRSLLAVMLAGLVSLTGFALAQDSAGQQPAPPAGEEHGGHRHFDPEQRTQMLTKQLKLNSDQQAKVLDILKSQQSQMESLRSDSSLSQDDRRAKMMDIHKASNDQIRGLLDANQQKKWDAMQSRHEGWQGHHPDGQGSGPSDTQK